MLADSGSCAPRSAIYRWPRGCSGGERQRRDGPRPIRVDLHADRLCGIWSRRRTAVRGAVGESVDAWGEARRCWCWCRKSAGLASGGPSACSAALASIRPEIKSGAAGAAPSNWPRRLSLFQHQQPTPTPALLLPMRATRNQGCALSSDRSWFSAENLFENKGQSARSLLAHQIDLLLARG